jgi:hypothetical protein
MHKIDVEIPKGRNNVAHIWIGWSRICSYFIMKWMILSLRVNFQARRWEEIFQIGNNHHPKEIMVKWNNNKEKDGIKRGYKSCHEKIEKLVSLKPPQAWRYMITNNPLVPDCKNVLLANFLDWFMPNNCL